MKHHNIKILYVQFRSFGDVLVSTAIIRKLKEKYDNCTIDYFTSSACMELLQGNLYVGRILPEIRPPIFEDYDILFRPYRCLQLAGGWEKSQKHFLDLYAEICGVDLAGVYKPEFYNVENVSPGLEKRLPNTVIVQTKTNDDAKDWSVPRWVQLVQLLRDHGLEVFQLGAPGDPAIQGAEDFRGATSFGQTAGFIKHALTTVCLDSAVQHLAGAIGASYIALYGAKHSYMVRTGTPVDSDKVMLQLAVNPENRNGCDGPCYLANCHRKNKCIDNIQADTIFDLVKVIESCKKASS